VTNYIITGLWHVLETREVHTGLCWGDLKEKHRLKDVSVDERIILKWIFKNWVGESWTEMIWLTSGGGGGGGRL